jgi:ribosomal protein L30E
VWYYIGIKETKKMRAKTNQVLIQSSVPPEIRDKLKAWAALQGMTMAEAIARLVIEAVKEVSFDKWT